MRFWKQTVLFYMGGSAYMTLEFLWRGKSHYSMFLLGGVCFLIIGRLGQKLPLAVRLILNSGVITALELVTGLIVNRNYSVWDYRTAPFNFLGQICLPFSLLWIPVSLLGLLIYNGADRLVSRK
jgi:uncharacterized membrane protein